MFFKWLLTILKRCFFTNYLKQVLNLNLILKINLVGNLFYFPIQKLAKILPNNSSLVTSPVISPK